MKSFLKILCVLTACFALSAGRFTTALTNCRMNPNDTINRLYDEVGLQKPKNLSINQLRHVITLCGEALASVVDDGEAEDLVVIKSKLEACLAAKELELSDCAAALAAQDEEDARLADFIHREEQKKLTQEAEDSALAKRFGAAKDTAPWVPEGVSLVGSLFKAVGEVVGLLSGAEPADAVVPPVTCGGGSGYVPGARRSPKPTLSDEERFKRQSYFDALGDRAFPDAWRAVQMPCLLQGANQCGVFAAFNAVAKLHGFSETDATAETIVRSVLEALRSHPSFYGWLAMNLLNKEQVQTAVEMFLGEFAGAAEAGQNFFIVDGRTNTQPGRRALQAGLKIAKEMVETNQQNIPSLVPKYRDSHAVAFQEIDRSDCVIYDKGECVITLQDLDSLAYPTALDRLELLQAYHSGQDVMVLTLVESCNHWVLYVLNKRDRQVQIFDSLNPSPDSSISPCASPEILELLEDCTQTSDNFELLQFVVRDMHAQLVVPA